MIKVARRRSAGLRPAVSQTFSLQGARTNLPQSASLIGLQNEILRYSRSETCATFELRISGLRILLITPSLTPPASDTAPPRSASTAQAVPGDDRSVWCGPGPSTTESSREC